MSPRTESTEWTWRLAFAALLVAGCGGGEPQATAPAPAPQTLTVLDWAGFEDPQMFSTFQEKYPNVTVSVAFGESDADIYAKMKAGADACVFHFYSGWQDFYPRDGLVRELDPARLSHWAEIPERFKALGRVDGKQYFIPWDWGFTSVLYRTDKLPDGVESWSTLFDPALAGHLSMWDDGPGAVAVASYIKGWDETKLTAEQLSQIEHMWVEQKKLNRFYWTGEPELVQGMASGEIWAAYAWQGAYATLLGEGVPVAYADPTEGRNSWVGLYGISPGCEELDLAYAFLDEKLAAAVGSNLINAFYYGHANPGAAAGVSDANVVAALALDDPSILDRTRFTPPVSEGDRDQFGQLWARVKAAQ